MSGPAGQGVPSGALYRPSGAVAVANQAQVEANAHRPESMRPTLIGDKWAVVAGHPLVSQVAADMLQAGGNAIDAGVAAALATCVVQPDMCNFGGIAPILVRPSAASNVMDVSGVGWWGRTATLESVLARYGLSTPLASAAAIVPGAPSAYITALREFGTRSFAEVAAPAIELARDGFTLDVRTANSLAKMAAHFGHWSSSQSVYCPQGRSPRPGERLVQPALALLLEELATAERGPDRRQALLEVHDCFYRGRAAAHLANTVSASGGFLDFRDFHDFTAEVSPAPSVEFNGARVFGNGSTTQGAVALQTLGILDEAGIVDMRPNSVEYLHQVIEALKISFSEREHLYGDARFTEIDLSTLTSRPYLAKLRSRITASAATWPTVGPTTRRGTTAIVVTDAEGAAFCVTPSDTADAGPLVPELGILCSPRGAQSRLTAGHSNVIAPRKRPCVTPASLLALTVGAQPSPTALACPGGDVIVQALVQTYLRLSVGDMTVQQAVEAPRIAVFDFPNASHPHRKASKQVYVEDRIDSTVIKRLEAAGHTVTLWPSYEFDAGSVQVIQASERVEGGRFWAAGADPRRSAYAAAR